MAISVLIFDGIVVMAIAYVVMKTTMLTPFQNKTRAYSYFLSLAFINDMDNRADMRIVFIGPYGFI